MPETEIPEVPALVQMMINHFNETGDYLDITSDEVSIDNDSPKEFKLVHTPKLDCLFRIESREFDICLNETLRDALGPKPGRMTMNFPDSERSDHWYQFPIPRYRPIVGERVFVKGDDGKFGGIVTAVTEHVGLAHVMERASRTHAPVRGSLRKKDHQPVDVFQPSKQASAFENAAKEY